MLLRHPTVAFLLKPFLRCRSDVRLWHFFYSPFCDVAQTSDCGISFKALYVVSLRCPTVASFPYFYLFTFRGVASNARSVFICVMLGFQAD